MRTPQFNLYNVYSFVIKALLFSLTPTVTVFVKYLQVSQNIIDGPENKKWFMTYATLCLWTVSSYLPEYRALSENKGLLV